MSILNQLIEDMKQALKAQDKLRLSTVRLLIAQLKNARIDSGRDLIPQDEINVLLNAAKKRNEAIEAYQAGHRPDLVEKEQKELEIIQQYLPQQMSDEEIEKTITDIMAATGASSLKDLGKVMSEAMKVLKGRADGKKIQQLVRAKLA